MLYPLNYGGLYEIYKSYASVGYPLFLYEKVRQGATQGAKSLRDFLQARVFAVSLAFSRVFTHITKGEQHLRRGLYIMSEANKKVRSAVKIYDFENGVRFLYPLN